MQLEASFRTPSLTPVEWSAVEDLLGHPVANRDDGAHAFWEDTYANDHGLLDNFNRLAWLGDRVLNLALADRREALAQPMKRWNGTGYQTQEQSEREAVDVSRGWPERVRAMLRLGNSKKGEANDRIVATFVEAIVGLLFREHGYDIAREFVWKHWLYSE